MRLPFWARRAAVLVLITVIGSFLSRSKSGGPDIRGCHETSNGGGGGGFNRLFSRRSADPPPPPHPVKEPTRAHGSAERVRETRLSGAVGTPFAPALAE